MKYRITLCFLLITLITISCGIDQNEVTLDMMDGEWQKISHYVIDQNDNFTDWIDTSNYYYTSTITKLSHDEGLWDDYDYHKSDLSFYSSGTYSFKISKSGTRFKFGNGFDGYGLSYEISFEGQNFILIHDGDHYIKQVFVPIE